MSLRAINPKRKVKKRMSKLLHKRAAESASDLIARVEVLKKTQLFTGLANDHEALAGFAAIMQDRAFAPKTNIIEEGAVSEEMFLLVSGEASVYRRTPEGDMFKVTVLNSSHHAFFGEGGLIGSEQ